MAYEKYGHLQGIIETMLLNVYCAHRIDAGDIVVDLGAGIGDFTLMASRAAGERGVVLAIEPSPGNFKLLQENIRSNNAKNVILKQYAVSNKEGEVEVNWADERYFAKAKSLSQIFTESIGVTASPSVIKADIEGAETTALDVAPQFLSKTHMISIELHGTKKEIDGILVPLGYRFKQFSQRTLFSAVIRQLVMHPIQLSRFYGQYKKLGGKRRLMKASLTGTKITTIGNTRVGMYYK
jgi:FkbM family methyltransferase